MQYFLPSLKRGMLLLGAILLTTVLAFAQEFTNGVRRGVVKVKFTNEMSQSLAQMKVQSAGDVLSTGMQRFDAAAKRTSAKNMYRLFPYDPKFEAKLRKHGLHLWYVVEIDKNLDPKTAVVEFRKIKEVAIAEVDREKTVAPFETKLYTPGASTMEAQPFNDPMLKDQWHYNNTSQTGFGDADINLFEAWTKTTGANDIIVSVHDQGVDVNHNDLKANIWQNLAEVNGVQGVDDDRNGYVDDLNGYNFERNRGAIDAQYHGTHVAGTIAAVNNNGIGVSGIAGGDGSGNGVKIMSLQILGGAPIEKSYVYAANNGAVISQNSWGYTSPGYVDQSVLDAIDYFIDEAGDYEGSPMKGGIVIFASGNSDYDADWYPGYYSNILSVSALGPEWKKASYSNFGTWVDIAAPGGDSNYGSKNGVLSTIPDNQYAFMDGTSMACPHVSGIAALALANRTKQLTNTELWNKLVTGAVSIDEHNESYLGKLGSGAIDALLAIANDMGIAPQAITTLDVTGIAQEFATLEWKVPSDQDDGAPLSFQLYYHTEPITTGNLVSATKHIIQNKKLPGETVSYEVTGLLGVTTYHFAVTSTDRWGNISMLSNIVAETTNEGPSISVDENSQAIELTIDAASSASAIHPITISNNASGILRWEHFMRHSNTELSFNANGIHYPSGNKKAAPQGNVAKRNLLQSTLLKSSDPATLAFTEIEKSYSSWPTNIIGDTDTTLTNSAIARFHVTEDEGFNLTQVKMYLKHDPEKGPVVVEIFKGTQPTRDNLVYAKEYSNWDASETWANVTLDEQLYFESGSTFWVAFHVPNGNLFPLGIGYEVEANDSDECFMSFDMGATWAPLATLINSPEYAWSMVAVSQNAHLGTYLVLEPGAGDVAGNEQTETTLNASAAALANGTYSANVVIASNDAQQRELRIPVTLTVTGHRPDLKHIDIADFGSVFVGTEKVLELVIDNQGFGNFNNPEFTISGSQFEIEGSAPWQIKAREEEIVKVKFKPTVSGNINDELVITNGDQTYRISLFGMGAETSKIVVTPAVQTIDNLTIGDVTNAQLTVKNTGAYPLKYFIPGYDTKGVSDNWPADYHTYGYRVRSSDPSEADPIPYEFQDISGTGTNIMDVLKDDGTYFTLDMGFKFPYYGQMMEKLYIAQKGFTTFDNSVRPINSPSLNNPYNPKGFISPLGSHLSYITQGAIYYQVEADRVIVQYDNVWDGWTPESITAQMVLYANGDIRFFYDKVEYSEYNQGSLNILIENLEQNDGILISNWQKRTLLYSGLAIGFDYPGPNIITNVVNGSGILAPGNSAVIDIEMNAASLAEGQIKRYVNFISNVPSNPQTNALVLLNVENGGIAEAVFSTDTIAFGDVFRGAAKSNEFTIKNPGTASVTITSINWVNNDFNLVGQTSTSIAPGLYKRYEVVMPTATLGALEDWLSINYADGTHDTVYVTGKVVVPPAINIDLSTLNETLAHGEESMHPLSIESTGLAALEVVTSGKHWLTFETPATPVDHDYVFEKHNNDGVYQWIDIRKTGTQLPFVDFEDFDNTFWRTLELPFPFEYYGVEYNSFRIGDNGLIAFEEDAPASFFTDHIPSQSIAGPAIMPYWTFSGFSDYLYPIEDIGIFYQSFDDKFIITWSYFVNNFGGMGDPVSAQAIFYKNGSMKFQYKVEEGGADITSHFGTIGLQKNKDQGLAISEYLPLDHGNGLAYMVIPAKKYSIAPGTTLSGQIHIDAKHIFGGQYNESLTIRTNVPGSEQMQKPVELTVTGEAQFGLEEAVDFGEKLVAIEFGSPKNYYIDKVITNGGSAPLEITWAQMTNANAALSLQIWAYVDGWFGKEWRWADISELYSPWAFETPVFVIKPGDELKVRPVFAPETTGAYTDELVFTTNLGPVSITLQGTAVEPSALNIDNTAISVVMNSLNETTTREIAFDNIEGKSVLNYQLSIDYGRPSTETSAEKISATSLENFLLSKDAGDLKPGVRPSGTYNRTISHTEKDLPDTWIGTGGAAPFTLATKYNAGAEGFNVSHVETYFRREDLEEGTIKVEIRAGGTSIADAVKLSEGMIDFGGTDGDETGAWYAIQLNNAAAIYPNEDFYVLITYPLGINYPQGTVTDEETVAGRYYYYDEGLWYNAQDVEGFAAFGWLMYVGEESPENSSWLTISSDLSGTLAAGEESEIELLIDGTLATRGDQIANVVVSTNDPEHTVTRIPVKLHMNEAPQFVDAPEQILISENEEQNVEIQVIDHEGHTFTVVPNQNYQDISYSYINGKLSVALSPAFGDAGSYAYVFVAKDQHNAESSLTLNVEVIHTNRPPVYVGPAGRLEYSANGKLNEYRIEDFFSDPDGDAIAFEVTTGNREIADVFSAAEEFIVRPLTPGATALEFIVSDGLDEIVYAIAVDVNLVLGIDEHIKQGVQLYPNPAKDVANVVLDEQWKGDVRFVITDLSGKQHMVHDVNVGGTKAISLDVKTLTAGFYILNVGARGKQVSVKLIKE
jgi:subtilisin family serine protease